MNQQRQAIQNNNALYEGVFSPHQIKFRQNAFIRYSLEKTPPLYSNLVTLSPEWKPDEVFREIDFNFQTEKWSEWSIKDSFAVLDLSEYGFAKLFDAQWLYLIAENFTPAAPKNHRLRFEIVGDEADLAAWRIAWDADEQLGKEIFQPELLTNPKIFFIAGYAEDKIACGCLVNRSGDVLGISNFFADGKETEYWSETVNFIFASLKRTEIVGYEQNEAFNQLKILGFKSVGNLTVWLKRH